MGATAAGEDDAGWGDGAAALPVATGQPVGRSATRVSAPITVAVGNHMDGAPRKPGADFGDHLVMAPESESESELEQPELDVGDEGSAAKRPLGMQSRHMGAVVAPEAVAAAVLQRVPAVDVAGSVAKGKQRGKKTPAARDAEEEAEAEEQSADGENPWLTIATDIGKTASEIQFPLSGQSHTHVALFFLPPLAASI